MTRRLVTVALSLTALAGAAWFLYDPPWVATYTSGLLNWEEEPPGVRLRWTKGHATFFVPSAAAGMTLPLRSWFPGPGGAPVVVSISVDDRFIAIVTLPNAREWVSTTLPLPRGATHRRSRRVDLHVSRIVPPFGLGVELGEVRAR